MNAAEITDKLGLHSLRQRAWYIQAACATSGDGLYEGLEWVSIRLVELLREAYPSYRLLASLAAFMPRTPLTQQLSTNLKKRGT